MAEKSGDEKSGGPSLSAEQIKQLEETLTNFVTRMKPAEMPAAMARPIGRGHGSHYQE